MITLSTLVWFVFTFLIGALIVALLWGVINWAEAELGRRGYAAPALVFLVLRFVFVLAVVFVLVCMLLQLIGHPIVALH